MSAYRIVFTKSALKDVEKLDKITKKRLKNKLAVFSLSPLEYAKRLVNSRIGEYRWRVGNYRVIFDLNKTKNIVIILRIRHRKEVYS